MIKEHEPTYIHSIINKINDHVTDKKVLEVEQLNSHLDYLMTNYFRYMVVSLQNDLYLLRARELKGSDIFTHVNELSYIRNVSNSFPPKGRVNLKGQSIFYACLYNYKENDDIKFTNSSIFKSALFRKYFNFTLSEVRAEKNKNYDILLSKIQKQLSLCYIGGLSSLLNFECPPFLSKDGFIDFEKKVKETIKGIDDSKLFCMQIVDYFFYDLLSRNVLQNKNLYDVTSYICSKILENDSDLDGIVFTSVQARNQSMLALKRETVDNKIQHLHVYPINILDYFGYNFYQLKPIESFGKIESNGEISQVNLI